MGKDSKVVVIDNGGGLLKVGLAGSPTPLRVFPNCILKPKSDKKSYTGDLSDEIKDISTITIRRPIEKGYVINWDATLELWTHIFNDILKIVPEQCCLLVTEPLFNLPSIQGSMDELAFGHFKFQKVLTAQAPALSMRHALADPTLAAAAASAEWVRARCGVVLDAGFSFVHAAPVYNGEVVEGGVRRINLGGKALTNYLKELVSFRAWNMMDEYLIIEDVKEKLCFVSQDIKGDLLEAKKAPHLNTVRREYVLPDGLKHTRGFVKEWSLEAVAAQLRRKRQEKGESKEEEQVLALANERFMVPEAIFHPSDIGIPQMGVAETIHAAVTACPPALHALMWPNVLCVGGCTMLPGFTERLYRELRPLVPEEYELTIRLADDPVAAAWKGGSELAASAEYDERATTLEEYRQRGNRAFRAGHRCSWDPSGGKKGGARPASGAYNSDASTAAGPPPGAATARAPSTLGPKTKAKKKKVKTALLSKGVAPGVSHLSGTSSPAHSGGSAGTANEAAAADPHQIKRIKVKFYSGQ
uniref:Actin-related protein 8 n=1 Tax=Pyramimonas obovata TaxID=1411642 RepID=A0A7S0WIK7_9CHLO|mmetsp:Transcript_26560/g.57765  ORF Transcript_26560/g.57765 Transcript_26560/m.57765 type:complete len:529 (+) Transcript_26560:296-1882(+)